MPDITLINPPISNELGNHPVPYGLWQLGSFLESNGIKVSILDLNYFWRINGLSLPQLNQLVQSVDSPVVGFTCMGNNLPTALELAIDLKKARPDLTIIFGGPHASLVGLDLLEAFECIDFVVVGEGEWTLLEIMKARRDCAAIDGIPGVLSRKCGFVPRKLSSSLDDLPYLNFNLIAWEKYLPLTDRDAVFFPILAGSGCPFQCIFCSTSVMWERRFRVKTPKRLVNEMLWLSSETGHYQFDLVHDIFTANRRYLHEFCAEIQNANTKWKCSSRIDGLTTADIRVMSKSKCSGVFFGVESGSQRIQQVIGKRLKVDQIRPTLANCIENEVDCVCSTVFGFPQETWEDIEATVTLCLDARTMGVGRANLHMLMALPGTPVFKESCFSSEIEARDLKRSGLPILTDRSHDLVKTHPKLCSAFYWIRHPSISKNEMFALSAWDSYLATYPQTLSSLIANQEGNLKNVLGLFCSHETDQLVQLAEVIKTIKNKELQDVCQEEELLYSLLHEQKGLRSSGMNDVCHWLLCQPDGTKVIYEIIPNAETISIYELTDDALLDWEDVYFDTHNSTKRKGIQIENTGYLRPVRQKTNRRSYYEANQND